MKIAIIGSRGYPYVYSGYETFVRELAERLVRRNVEVTVYCHKNLFKDRPPVVNGVKLVYLPTIEKKTMSQFIHSLQAFLHACFRRHDIVLAVNSANGPFGILTKMFGVKTAINVDGLEWLRPKWKGLGAGYFYLSSMLATKFFDVVVNDSSEMQKIYEKEFNARSEVIAYGADMRYSKNSALIDKWGLSREGYYLIVGRLIPDNNADIMIREFTGSVSTKKLVIVGDVPYRDRYAARVKDNADPRVVFTGYITDQDDLSELFCNCYAYLHGHEFGGTNPTLLQALACGCAVIALDTVFSREMLNGSEYGILFTKGPGVLKKIIDTVENDDTRLRDLRGISRRRITACYSWEKITDRYLELFERMARA